MKQSSVIISHRLTKLSFGLLSSRDVKKLSVKEVTNPESFDSLSHCTVNGVYDPAFGECSGYIK